MVKRFFIFLAAISLFGCAQTASSGAASLPQSGSVSSNVSGVEAGESTAQESHISDEAGEEKAMLKITVGEHEFWAAFEDNVSAQEFKELLEQGPITVSMDDYGGFEKVGPLGTILTRSDESITTQPGDVILYQGSQITIYYAPNSWNFTKVAKIEDVSDLKEKLGKGRIEATFSLAEPS